MITAKILKNGVLKITADNEGRAMIKEAYAGFGVSGSGGYPRAEMEVIDELGQRGWEFVRPEWVAALTDAPIITDDIIFADNGDVEYVGDVWWFPNYMVTDPWEVLKNKGRVYFEPEENNKSLPKD